MQSQNMHLQKGICSLLFFSDYAHIFVLLRYRYDGLYLVEKVGKVFLKYFSIFIVCFRLIWRKARVDLLSAGITLQ